MSPNSEGEDIKPCSLYFAVSVLSFYKIALERLGKIASNLAHSENGSFLPRTAAMAVFTFSGYAWCYMYFRHNQWIGIEKDKKALCSLLKHARKLFLTGSLKSRKFRVQMYFRKDLGLRIL